jgi:plastocyanin
MHKLLLLIATVAALAVTAGASAATATVTITKTGYVPSASTIAVGDSVQFMNTDTVAHQVVFKPTTGFTCSPNPLVVQPGQSGTCTFQTAGTYTYSDPNGKGNTYRGTVTVNAAAGGAITLAAAPKRIVYGNQVTLSGALATHRAGETLDVLAQACGSSTAQKVTTVQTTTNGAYSVGVRPLQNTTYTVKLRNSTSNAVAVSVRPRVVLSRLAPHRYSARISAAQSFAGKYGTLQRYNGTRWIAVKSVLLRANSTGVAPTVITTASFRSSLRTGIRVRLFVAQAQVGGCYLPGISNTVRS